MSAPTDVGLYRAYGALLLMAVLPIVTGSFASLRVSFLLSELELRPTRDVNEHRELIKGT